MKENPHETDLREIVAWLATKEGQEFLSHDIDEFIERLLQENLTRLSSLTGIPSRRIWERVRQLCQDTKTD